MEKIHTRFKLEITPVGEESYIQSHTFENQTFDYDYLLDEYLDGHKIIKDAQYYSKYGMLENWQIVDFELLSACELGMIRALKMMDEVQKRRKANSINNHKDLLQGDKTIYISKHNITEKDGVVSHNYYSVPKIITEFEWIKQMDNCWITPDGEIIPIDSPGNGISHCEWASDYLDKINYNFDRYDNGIDWGKSSTDILQRMGFIRIASWGNREDTLMETDKYPTIAQWKSLQNWCFVKDCEFPKWSDRDKLRKW